MAQLNPTKVQMERLKAAFAEVKAENDEVLTKHQSRTFVQTRVYRDVQRANRCLLIGGKGAGKTALLLGYQAEHVGRYLSSNPIDITADYFPIEPLFAFFFTDTQRAIERVTDRMHRISDLPAFVDPVRVASFAWLQSLRCASVYFSAGYLLQHQNELTDVDRAVLSKARRVIAKFMGYKGQILEGESGSEVVFSLLIFFFHSVQSVIDIALGMHTENLSVLLAAITRKLTRKLNARLDKSIEEAARVIKHRLQVQSKSVLVTLDKFDDFYDEFYRQTRNDTHGKERRTFLNAILQGLVVAARDLRRDERFAWLHMLFTIPMDKFLELHLRERVEFETSHVLKLEWTPPELLQFVNRRIAYALNLPEERVDDAWSLLFPFEVTNGKIKEVKEDSFLYLVRHSLWRPREIQMFVSAILELMDSNREPATEELFRRAVKSETEKIIRTEFFEEFVSEFPGIPRVLTKLENLTLRTVMPYEELCDKLSGLSLSEDLARPDEVLLRLFHMGVIGVRQVLASRKSWAKDATITQNREEVSYRFCYNSQVNDPFTTGINTVFHPMFFEYLNIRHEEKYVVNQLSWDMFDDSRSSTTPPPPSL